MREALLYEKLTGARVRCGICQWRCVILPGHTGVCRMYRNRAGILYNINYGLVSSVAIDPIEKKPLYHFFPGSRVFSLGGWGCNFHCGDCQNWEIAMAEETVPGSQLISPETAVQLALQQRCDGIAWTYNEPSVWFEYTLESAKLAKQAGLYTVYVTNGYLTPAALDLIGPYLDAWRVDVKGFSDRLYETLAKVKAWREILAVAERARHKWGMHVEVVTNIIPTLNDDEQQLKDIAGWIKTRLGEHTPWHVTRFHPNYHITDLPITPVATLEKACRLGRESGLNFIYVGNVPGHPGENTVCYQCGKTVVTRNGYDTRITGLDGAQCRFCGADLNFRVATAGGETNGK